MFERFTERAREIVTLAQKAAQEMGHGGVYPVHLVLGLIDEGGGLAAQVLEDLGVSREELVQQSAFADIETAELPDKRLILTPNTKEVIERSLREAISLGNNFIGTEHFLLALSHPNYANNAMDLLEQVGIQRETLRSAVMERLQAKPKITKDEVKSLCRELMIKIDSYAAEQSLSQPSPYAELRKALDDALQI